MIKIQLTKEVFRDLKKGDVISNKHDFLGGPAGYDYEVVQGYHVHDHEGCIMIRIVFGKDDAYKGRPYRFYESQVDACLGLYKKCQ